MNEYMNEWIHLGFHCELFSLVSFKPSIELDKYMTSLTIVLENFQTNFFLVILIIVT
jgi:hypothetical protein